MPEHEGLARFLDGTCKWHQLYEKFLMGNKWTFPIKLLAPEGYLYVRNLFGDLGF